MRYQGESYSLKWLCHIIALPTITLATLFACAEIGSPPGGDEDRKGPFLIGSIPENESVNVPPGNKITLFFSEPVQKPDKGVSVFISPRTIEPPKVKWKKDYIVITMPTAFDPDQTYVVTVNSTVRDWRNNPIDSLATIAFSTGMSIDTGLIAGHLSDENAPVAGALVALYDMESLPDTLVYDSIYPDYLTTTKKDGAFSFHYLPSRTYRLAAFKDKNRDERLNPYRESFAVPDREIVVGGDLLLEDLNLRLVRLDTLMPAILSATQTADNLIRLRLSKSIPLEQLSADIDRITLIPLDSEQTVIEAHAYREAGEKEASSLAVYFGSISEGDYRIQLEYDSSLTPLRFDPVKIKTAEDKTPPTIVAFQPENRPTFVDLVDMQMSFSEPIDTAGLTPQTFVLFESESRAIPVSWRWTNPFHLQFTPYKLNPGKTYRLNVTEFDLSDLHGNLVGDSLTQYEFSTLDNDSLGQVSGKVTVEISDRQDHPVLLTFKNVATQHAVDFSALAESFSVNLPAGKYILSGFVDSDKDGHLGNGSLIPFSIAETQARYPDTIAVRARFETTEILFEIK